MTTWAHAALVIRTALGELHRPGTAGRQWRFLANTTAVAAGVASAAALGTTLAGTGLGPGHAARALLGGILTAFIVDRLMDHTPGT